MSKKVIESDEKKSIREFDDYFKLYQEKESKEVEELYTHIKESYKLRFKDNQIKIKIEKINLERNIGKYQGALRKHGLTFLIGILGVMIQLLLPEFLKMFGINNSSLNFAVMFICLIFFMSAVGKDFDKERPKDLMKFIALKVLEDIEKETNENKARQEKEANRERSIEQIKQHIDSNNVIKNTVLPVIAEIAATTVVKKGILKTVLNKIKRK
ncbi:hypothetical protein [Clostridium magnum]|uniref:Uncharacterized protein n=1 Tax=Clostridium magnum DSM 2767 TaxID=1121326 RepID=A0A161YFF1_9CLOT|nr:hypothetical protein [Clostridium magnum]KZL88782.1 hypothetical protein CLMAG_58750 [Clostridium magnum DSM 2767]SHJ57472.1 hypothetical protein SAMN02745944_06177 [Clostridium magnum DSM 2767]